MPDNPSPFGSGTSAAGLVLGVDTCGPSGSVALARLNQNDIRILGQKELAGRSYSATLIAAISELLVGSGVTLREVGAIVIVNGPGSFTGVRVGLSAAKGLAEGSQVPVVAVSRLEVLAKKACATSAALDAHRHEVFLRLECGTSEAHELLAGAAELAKIEPRPERVAVCDEGAAAMLQKGWPEVTLLPTCAPDASDAMRLALPRILARDFADIALLDGHYLRRSDAEIFGEPGAPARVPLQGRGK
jgi:tRNA threonylcarbamoyladenosine biosynthesis protein TsaB